MTDIYVVGYIGKDTTAEQVREQLDAARGKDVLVRINSPGGSFSDGPAIYSYLQQHDGAVWTQIDGIAYSMAAILAQAGSQRTMAANAIMMLHGAQGGNMGSAPELRETAQALDAHTEVMSRILRERGINPEKISAWLRSGNDYYFTADEALNEGLVDQVSNAIDLAAALRHIPGEIVLPEDMIALNQPTISIDMSNNTANDTKHGQSNPPSAAAGASTAVRDAMTRRTEAERAAIQEGIVREHQRQDEIRALFSGPGFASERHQEIMRHCLDDQHISPAEASRILIESIGDGFAPVVDQTTDLPNAAAFPGANVGAGRPRPATAGADQLDKFIEGAERALTISARLDATSNADLTKKERDLMRKERRSNEFLAMSPYEMARYFLTSQGVAATGSRENILATAMMLPARRQLDIAGAAAGHTGSDFAHLLSNVANKSLLRGFEQAGETWRGWCSVGSLRDFKKADLVNVSLFDDLKEVGPSGEYRHGTMEDIVEHAQLVTYGALFGITRVAMANDDTRALSQTPRKMGLAAGRMVGDVAYRVLTSNPVMDQDGKTLFHADHGNIGTPGEISVMPKGTLDELVTAMRTQKDPQGIRLNIRARRLVVPAALEISTSSTIADATIRDTGAAQEMRNPFRDRLTVHADARLDDDSTTRWYLLADQNVNDTVEVLFLNGQEEPFMDSKDGWTRDGIEYKVRIDVTAKALDFRSIAKNDGA